MHERTARCVEMQGLDGSMGDNPALDSGHTAPKL